MSTRWHPWPHRLRLQRGRAVGWTPPSIERRQNPALSVTIFASERLRPRPPDDQGINAPRRQERGYWATTPAIDVLGSAGPSDCLLLLPQYGARVLIRRACSNSRPQPRMEGSPHGLGIDPVSFPLLVLHSDAANLLAS